MTKKGLKGERIRNRVAFILLLVGLFAMLFPLFWMVLSAFKTKADVPTEYRMRILRLIENITMGTAAVGYLTESMHGAGSPQAQRIMIARLANMKQKQKVAKFLCGIDKEK